MPSFIGSPSDIAIKPWAPVPPHTRAGGLDNVIRGWDLRTDEVVLELKGHGDTVTGLSLSPDGSRLLSNSMDSTLKAWDVAPFSPSERCVATFEGHSHDFHKNLLRCSWSHDGEKVACGSADQIVHVWDVASTCVEINQC